MNNGIARTPPLGWMSWMYYTTDINEGIIKGVADELVRGGYRDAGERMRTQTDGERKADACSALKGCALTGSVDEGVRIKIATVGL